MQSLGRFITPVLCTVFSEQWHNAGVNINYHKVSNISCTKSPNLDVSRLVVQLSSPNPMKPGVKSRMKM